jgi:uncharacterized protein with NRDE domain
MRDDPVNVASARILCCISCRINSTRRGAIIGQGPPRIIGQWRVLYKPQGAQTSDVPDRVRLAAHPAALLLAANRDEFHRAPARQRPSGRTHPRFSPAATWRPGAPGWVSAAAVASRRSPIFATRAGAATAPRSRGELTAGSCWAMSSPRTTWRASPRASPLSGVQPAVATARRCGICMDHRGKPPQTPRQTGIYGLSNAALDVPWPKVSAARDALRASLERRRAGATACGLRGGMPAGLAACETAPWQRTGSERRHGAAPLRAVHCHAGAYGTRCCTTLRWHRGWQPGVCEQRFDNHGCHGLREFTLPAP